MQVSHMRKFYTYSNYVVISSKWFGTPLSKTPSEIILLWMQANWSYHFIVTHILIKIYVTQPNDPPYSHDLGHFQKIKSSLKDKDLPPLRIFKRMCYNL